MPDWVEKPGAEPGPSSLRFLMGCDQVKRVSRWVALATSSGEPREREAPFLRGSGASSFSRVRATMKLCASRPKRLLGWRGGFEA